jgi:hypothetical protein
MKAYENSASQQAIQVLVRYRAISRPIKTSKLFCIHPASSLFLFDFLKTRHKPRYNKKIPPKAANKLKP